MEEKEEVKITKNEKTRKRMGIFTIMIFLSAISIIFCGYYLIHSFSMVKKYDVNSFKLGEFEIPTFNSALNSKKKLVSAAEKNGVVTLKYDIEKIKLNDVYAYLEKLSGEGYVVVNLEELYMRTVHLDNNIQIKITVGSNHLVFDYNIGIDKEEPKKDEEKEETKEKDETTESKTETE